MSNPHATPEAPAAHAVEHHGSWAPIIVAASVLFFYLALLWPLQMAPIGLIILTIGLGWWIREDMIRFKHHQHNPADAHGWAGGLWGTILFIGTEVLIFGSIFAVWFMGKAHAVSWPPEHFELPVFKTFINTVILVSSGGTLHWGYLRLKKNDYRGYLIGLFATIVLGAIFLGIQVNEYLGLVHEGLTIKAWQGTPTLYGSAFYMLTGTHGAHVLGGLIALGIVFVRSLKRTQSKEHHLALETASIYWHFVDVVWIFLFAVVYLQKL